MMDFDIPSDLVGKSYSMLQSSQSVNIATSSAGTHIKDVCTLVLNKKFGVSSAFTLSAKVPSAQHHRICKGDVVKLVCREGTGTQTFVDALSVEQKQSVSYETHFFLVLFLFEVTANEHWSRNVEWAAAVRFHKTGGAKLDYQYHIRFGLDALHLFQVRNTVSKCAILHNCDSVGSCIFQKHGCEVQHHIDTVRSNEFFLFSGSNGYPFRSA